MVGCVLTCTQPMHSKPLEQLYAQVASPRHFVLPGDHPEITAALTLPAPLQGMLTALYTFQRRSLAAMLRREERNPPPTPDPLFITLADREGGTLFYDVAHGLVVSERPDMAPVRGGILCENTGKCTHLSLPSTSTHHCSIIGRGKIIILLALFVLSTRREPKLCNLPLVLQRLPSRSRTSRVALRQKDEHVYRRLYMSDATLLLIPHELLDQWQEEYTRHCRKDTLRILVVTDLSKLPAAPKLAKDYDVSAH